MKVNFLYENEQTLIKSQPILKVGYCATTFINTQFDASGRENLFLPMVINDDGFNFHPKLELGTNHVYSIFESTSSEILGGEIEILPNGSRINITLDLYSEGRSFANSRNIKEYLAYNTVTKEFWYLIPTDIVATAFDKYNPGHMFYRVVENSRYYGFNLEKLETGQPSLYNEEQLIKESPSDWVVFSTRDYTMTFSFNPAPLPKIHDIRKEETI